MLKSNNPTDSMVIKFFGVRGTLPVPGEKTNSYGGNTNCVTLRIGDKHFFIFDAGSGIKELSNFLVEQKQFPIHAKIFISHPHYDHIHGIPFFVPLYMKGNEFDIFGTQHGGMNIKDLLSNQMDHIYFPVTMDEFSATLKFYHLGEEIFDIEDVKIKTKFLNHPGNCLGYRVEYNEKVFCYITDNELYLENSVHYKASDVEHLINFIEHADVLVIDTTYDDKEYLRKVGWGHSCVSQVVDLADRASVKLLCLYHHDPDQYDDDIDRKLASAQTILKSRNSQTECIAPKEGDEIIC